MSVPTAQVVTTQAAVQGDVALRPVIPVSPGQTIAARVVANDNGQLELAIGGQRMVAVSDIPLEPGEAVRLVVQSLQEERVTMQLVARGATLPQTASGQTALANGAQARPAGLPQATAQALFTALTEMGVADLDSPLPQAATARAAFAARAAEAGVGTPAQAAAFARLAAAGLPTTPAAVAGMAELAEGPPLGRMLALITGPQTPGAAAGQAPAAGQPAVAAGAAQIATPAVAQEQAAPAGQPAALSQASAQGQVSPAAQTVTPAAVTAHTAEAAATRTARAEPQTAMAQLATLVRDVAEAAASGDPARLRDAVARLGHGLEARLATGAPPPDADANVRSLLLAVAQSPDASLHTRGMADRAADALGAQALMGPALSQASDGAQQGAYLQMPLPGGQTAEVHVNPDGGGDGPGREGGRGTRVAFALTMSHLGPLVIEASVGPGGVDAVVRSQAPAVREFLASQTADLAEGLARAIPDGPRPRVSVERLSAAGGSSTGLAPPPPPSGLDLSA